MESSASQMHKLAPFNVHDITYKTVSNTAIDTTILIPKGIKSGKHPLLVRWHGGYLITGARMFLPFFHQWVLDFALSHSAIIVVPDYRLIPESSGFDILEDVTDFWSWTRNSLPGELRKLDSGIEIDLERIAVVGESAGGYLSVQSALLHPEVGIKAIIAQYPILDVTSDFYTKAYEKPIFGLPQQPEDLVENHIASMKPVMVADPSDPLSRLGLAFAIVQQGRYLELLGQGQRVQPLENLKAFKGELPFLFVCHGNQDSAVPAEGTKVFEKLLKEMRPDAKAKFAYEDGEHGFDKVCTLETSWLMEGLKEVQKAWL
jgi:acetyl esterase/lipase